MIIASLGCFLFGSYLTVELEIGYFIVMTIPIGIGLAAAAITLAILPQAVVTTSELARTVTMVFFIHDLGIGMGFAVMEYLFISALPIWLRDLEVEPSSRYSADFLIATKHFFNGGGVLCIICALTSLGLDPIPLRTRAPDVTKDAAAGPSPTAQSSSATAPLIGDTESSSSSSAPTTKQTHEYEAVASQIGE
jgi:hypothetical protein